MHAGQGANALEHPAEVTDLLLRFCELAWWKRDRHGDNVTGIEAGIYMVQRPQAANQQTGGNQQHQRKRNFRYHQHVARAAAARIRGCAAQPLL